MSGAAAGAAHAALWGLLAAACVFDVRERRLPNRLAAALALAGLACAALSGGIAAHLAAAVALAGALVLFELAWRRLRSSSGMGMGDVKCVFALELAYPAATPVALAAGLLALAVAGVASGQRALPAIPFLAGGLAAVLVLERLFR